MDWHDVCARSDLRPERGWPVTVAGRRVAVFCAAGTLFAVSNVCVHLGSPIDEGMVDRGCVTCPWHGWRYDLASGDHLTLIGRHPGLISYPVREQDGRVLVAMVDDEVPGR